jgi:hypothetical protein
VSGGAATITLKDAAGGPVVDRPDLGGFGNCQLTVGP